MDGRTAHDRPIMYPTTRGRRLPWLAVRSMAMLLLVGLGGCTYSCLTTASTMRQGQGQLILSPGYTRYQRGSGEPLYTPQIELGGRYAITDRVEVGGKVWLPGVQLDCKIGLVGVGAVEDGFHLSLDPSFGYLGGFEGTPDGGGNTLHIITFSLPVLMGWTFWGHELVVGPRLVDQIWTATGTSPMTANILSGGTSVGIALQIMDGVRIMPEISFGFIFLQSLSDFGTHFGVNGSMIQANIGFLFGGGSVSE